MTEMLAIPANRMLAESFSGGGWDARTSVNMAGRSVYPDFLTDCQKERLERICHDCLLFEGHHRAYYLEGGRSQFDFPYVKSCGRTFRMYYDYNMLGLICVKGADLLFGQTPSLDVEDELQYAALQELVRRTKLPAVLHEAAVYCNAEGETFLEATVWQGQVYIHRLANDEVFPEGEIQPDGQYPSYVRYTPKNIGTKDRPIWLLLLTRSLVGKIQRECWQLDDQLHMSRRIALEHFDPALQGMDSTPTGIDLNTIVWVPNFLGRAEPDTKCARPQQDALNAKNTQIARVLQKHGDPKLAAPKAAADAKGNLPAAAEVYWFDDADQIPKYITWDAQLEIANSERDKALTQLLVRTETSPVLLGLKEGAAPDAYKKVRLEAFNSVTKASRKSVLWTPAIDRVLLVAQKLENTIPGRGYRVLPVGITLNDGIPIDESEQATNIVNLRSASAMSRYRAVYLQLKDKKATDAEVAQIEKETAAMAPTVTLTGPVGEPAMQGDRGQGSGDSQTATGAGSTTAAEAEAAGQSLQTTPDTVLNGAQATAGKDIVAAVVAGELPRDSGVAMLAAFFNLDPAKADAIMGSAGTKKPTTPNPNPQNAKAEGSVRRDGAGHGGRERMKLSELLRGLVARKTKPADAGKETQMGAEATTATPAAANAGLTAAQTAEIVNSSVTAAVTAAVKPLQDKIAALEARPAPASLKAEDVAKLVTDGLTAQQTAAAAARTAGEKRTATIAAKLKGVPAVYAEKLGTDETKWDAEAATLRAAYQADLKAAGIVVKDVSTDTPAANGGAATVKVGEMVDLSKLSGDDLIDLAVKQNTTAQNGQTVPAPAATEGAAK